MRIFQESLQEGKTGESLIAQHFLRKGYSVLPVYEILPGAFKGPVLFTASHDVLVAPDMLVLGKDKIFWIEAKHKTAFSWHRTTECWNTGIDKHHFEQYLAVQELHPTIPVWLLFLHKNGTAKDTPEGLTSPSGLFGNSLTYLARHIHHKDMRWGRHGMVYWELRDLKMLAPLDDFLGDIPNR